MTESQAEQRKSEQGSEWKDVQLMHESDEVELATSPALVWKALLADVEELHPPFHIESDPPVSHLLATNFADLLVVDVGRGSGGGRGSGSSLSPVGVATGSVGS